MSKLTQQARELLDGITPWPWEASYNPHDTSYPSDTWHVITAHTGDLVAEVDDESRGYEEPHAEFGKDAEFIAAAPQLVADLTAALERVEKVADFIEKNADFSGDSGPLQKVIAGFIRDALEGK